MAVIAGCQPAAPIEVGHDILPAPENVISAQQLACRLRLTVDADRGTVVSLRNAANCVTLFADPGGQTYVNGRPVGPRGGFVRVRGVLFVPASLEGHIRAALKPLPAAVKPPPRSGRRIVIDAGHGGKDPGAISPIGLMEKDVVLPASLEVARLLREAGHEVILTRQTDVFLELDDRAEVANRRDADLFVSIHADSAANRDARGFTVYVCRGASSGSQTVAKAVVHSLDSGSGLDSRGVRAANYRVLVRTQCPAILVELGYLSNRQEALMLRQDAVQKKLARCIAEGIDSFLRRPR
jgi:N-acetylmuramoyl-L-alanine amidase